MLRHRPSFGLGLKPGRRRRAPFAEWEQLVHRRRHPAGVLASVLGHVAVLLLAASQWRVPPPASDDPAQRRPSAVQMMYLLPKEEPPKPRPEPPLKARRPPPAPAVPEPTPRPMPELPAPIKSTVAARKHDEPAASSPQPANRGGAAAPATEDPLVSEARRLFGPRSPSGGGNRGPVQTGLPLALETGAVRCAWSGAETQAMERPSEGVIEGIVRAESNGRPVPGAFLQVIGTGFATFADDAGHYRLSFDPGLIDVCRTQLVRVTASGYRARTMLLGLGLTSDNAIDLPGRP